MNAIIRHPNSDSDIDDNDSNSPPPPHSKSTVAKTMKKPNHKSRFKTKQVNMKSKLQCKNLYL